MAFCINCGKELQYGAAFCTNCGKAIDAPVKTREKAPIVESREKKNGKVTVIVLGVLAFVLLTILMVVLFKGFMAEKSSKDLQKETVQEYQEPTRNWPGYQVEEESEPVYESAPAPAPEIERWVPEVETVVTPAPASEYLLPQSNVRKLVSADLDHLTHEELCFARNEIYARHGWIFSIREIADYFAGKSWYYGTTLPADFDIRVLSDIEQYNISVIMDYEAYHYGGSYY